MNTSPSDPRGAVSVRNQQNGIGCVIAFCAVFMLIGLGTFVFAFVLPLARTIQNQNWVATPCSITGGNISRQGGKTTTYRYDVEFTYQVNGQTYGSSRRSFFPKSSGSYSDAVADSVKWPAGGTATCYVNPANPTEAVLIKGFDGNLLAAFVPLIFVAFGALFLILVLKGTQGEKSRRAKWRPARATTRPQASPRGRPDSAPPSSPSPFVNSGSGQGGSHAGSTGGSMAPAGSSNPFADISALSSGRAQAPSRSNPTGSRTDYTQVLAPEGGPPLARAGCMVGFALFWNGITLFMAYQFVKDMSGSFFMILPILFFIPFLLIGAVLAGVAISGILGAFNPRPIVTVSGGMLRPGGSVEVAWRLEGGIRPPTSLSVTVEGREEATYRRGTDTYTDKSIFFRDVLQDGTSPSLGGGNIASGQVRVQIPENLMHSFESANNKIIYIVRLDGPYPRWPDLKEEFRIVVEPGLPRTGGAVTN